jgi:hypothetical protein
MSLLFEPEFLSSSLEASSGLPSVSGVYSFSQNCMSDHKANAIELKLSLESTSLSATQKLQSLLRNLEVHYRVRKSLSLDHILSKMNRVHTTQSYFFKIHFNIILSPMSRTYYWFLSFWLSHKSYICILLSYHACHISYPSYSL